MCSQRAGAGFVPDPTTSPHLVIRPVPLDEEPEQARTTGLGQLRLLTEEGTEASLRAEPQRRHKRDKAAV